jgi:hypothetical protein
LSLLTNPAQRGRRDWAKGGILKLALYNIISKRSQVQSSPFRVDKRFHNRFKSKSLSLKPKCFDAGFFVDSVNILTLPELIPPVVRFTPLFFLVL